ncbi:MAG: hypothetical protein OXH45_00150 [Gammaproteobacteria bacterium]|nr:hypothetical protein [Gammaproteobacteria bacterium]
MVIGIVAMPAISPTLTHFIVAGVTSLSSTPSIQEFLSPPQRAILHQFPQSRGRPERRVYDGGATDGTNR